MLNFIVYLLDFHFDVRYSFFKYLLFLFLVVVISPCVHCSIVSWFSPFFFFFFFCIISVYTIAS